ncbi:SGNH/GDSL hydrolase family protein [Streptomyces sp. WAC00469]|uniref:SGNH/GDSL hydrolase family protein n=1 Tax=Streptomyces sp. WAC00469 TaxID=2487415 RepID=UPI000F741136|nr:SGNH/GDSL hydrolase family protein [Streptomyces sp. WAC00469]RSS00611.1 SGNH/GDSL hydrolase family protein [Streptomyces sp. WAC00469]
MSGARRRRGRLSVLLTVTATAALLLGGAPSAGARSGAGPAAAADGGVWSGTWGTAPAPAAPDGISRTGLDDRTVRMIAHTSVGGEELRLRLSNAHGTQEVEFGRVTVGLATSPDSAAAVPDSLRPVTFDGASSTTVPAGAEVVSDPLPYPVPGGADLLISVHLPKPTGPTTWHWLAQQTSYVSEPGDHTGDPGAAAFTGTETSWFFLTGVDVRGPATRGTVVALGDSQTDGSGSTLNGNGRWTDAFARRLSADPATAGLGVLNKGIGGNRVLRDGTETERPQRGTSALGRLDRDVLNQSEVRAVVLYEGINDLQLAPYASAEEVLDGLRTLAERLHARGIRVVVGTLTPFKDSPLWTAEAERQRVALNAALRTCPDFDAVADFDAAVRDPADPQRVRAAYDSGDHIHLNDSGYRAVADAVPTDLLAAGHPAATAPRADGRHV